MAAAGVAVAVMAGAAVTEGSVVAGSFALLGHLHWLWAPAAIVLESASMAAFAIMLRRLLAAGGARVGVRPMLATAYAANALSVSVPLAGPELATAFTFRRFTRQGADAPLAGWSLLVGGVVSTAAGVLVVGGGGLASGNILATAARGPRGLLALGRHRPAGNPGASRRTALPPGQFLAGGLGRMAGPPLAATPQTCPPWHRNRAKSCHCARDCPWNRTTPWPLTSSRFTCQPRWALTSWCCCCCKGSQASRTLACSSSKARVITCPGAPPMWSPMRSWRSWPQWKSTAAWLLEQLTSPTRVSTTGAD